MNVSWQKLEAINPNQKNEKGQPFGHPRGEYRIRTGRLLHAMQAL